MSCCFKPKPSTFQPNEQTPQLQNLKQHHQILQIPSCKVHLLECGESLELAHGDFTLVQIYDENAPLATLVTIGHNSNDVQIQWPLTKDEPVVKLDRLNYLFSLPMKDGEPLSYGVSFLEQFRSDLGLLDSFLKENSCFTMGFSESSSKGGGVEWREFAPSVEEYNNVIAKAIAGGTGHVVKGIFKCSNAYTNQVQKGGEMILNSASEDKTSRNRSSRPSKNSNKVNKSLKRVRKLSKMTEKLSKTMLNGVGIASGSVMAPLVKSQAGKKFLSMVPGEVLLASLDAVNKIMDAAEVAEKRAMSATSKATTRMVSNRFGESAGEATEDVLATAQHCACAAWNIFKIRKAINPSSSVSAGMLRNSARANISYRS